MPQKSASGQTFTTTRHYPHCSNKYHVDQLIQFVCLKIIKPTLIYRLSKYFNRWLRPIFLFRRHIHVINEYDEFMSGYLRPIDPLPLFLQA